MRADELLRESDPALADIFSRLCKDVAARVNMDARDRRLAVLAALMGCGGADAFRAELADALEEGIPAVAAREAVMQGAAYLGMGRALPFVQAMAQVFAANGVQLPPEVNDARDRAQRGEAAQVAIFGEGMRGFHASGDELGRPVNALLSENCFGDYYVREGISFRERELVTFCFLAAQGGCEAQLAGHVAGNFQVGNDAAYLGGAVLCILPWIGYPRSLNALACVRNSMKKV